jgi:hypothetical protein
MYDSAFGSLYNTDSASVSVDATSCNSEETPSGQGERYEGLFSNAHISAIEEVLQNSRARKNLAARKPPVDVPSINKSSCSEEVDDSEDEVVRPKPALSKIRRGCDADKVLRKTDEVQEATSQSKTRSPARSARQAKPAKTIQTSSLTRSTKLL